MGDTGEVTQGSTYIPPCSSRVIVLCLALSPCFHWLPIPLEQKHSGSWGQKRNWGGQTGEPGSLTVVETFTWRSTEIQETKALPSRAIFCWQSLEASRGVAAREKRLEKDLEGRGVPSADGWTSPTPVPHMPLSSPTAPALVCGIKC